MCNLFSLTFLLTVTCTSLCFPIDSNEKSPCVLYARFYGKSVLVTSKY